VEKRLIPSTLEGEHHLVGFAASIGAVGHSPADEGRTGWKRVRLAIGAPFFFVRACGLGRWRIKGRHTTLYAID
jgi:hypothetical protein